MAKKIVTTSKRNYRDKKTTSLTNTGTVKPIYKPITEQPKQVPGSPVVIKPTPLKMPTYTTPSAPSTPSAPAPTPTPTISYTAPYVSKSISTILNNNNSNRNNRGGGTTKPLPPAVTTSSPKPLWRGLTPFGPTRGAADFTSNPQPFKGKLGGPKADFSNYGSNKGSGTNTGVDNAFLKGRGQDPNRRIGNNRTNIEQKEAWQRANDIRLNPTTAGGQFLGQMDPVNSAVRLMSGGDKGNAGYGKYTGLDKGLDAVSLIPGLGLAAAGVKSVGKGAKVVKALTKSVDAVGAAKKGIASATIKTTIPKGLTKPGTLSKIFDSALKSGTDADATKAIVTGRKELIKLRKNLDGFIKEKIKETGKALPSQLENLASYDASLKLLDKAASQISNGGKALAVVGKMSDDLVQHLEKTLKGVDAVAPIVKGTAKVVEPAIKGTAKVVEPAIKVGDATGSVVEAVSNAVRGPAKPIRYATRAGGTPPVGPTISGATKGPIGATIKGAAKQAKLPPRVPVPGPTMNLIPKTTLGQGALIGAGAVAGYSQITGAGMESAEQALGHAPQSEEELASANKTEQQLLKEQDEAGYLADFGFAPDGAEQDTSLLMGGGDTAMQRTAWGPSGGGGGGSTTSGGGGGTFVGGGSPVSGLGTPPASVSSDFTQPKSKAVQTVGHYIDPEGNKQTVPVYIIDGTSYLDPNGEQRIPDYMAVENPSYRAPSGDAGSEDQGSINQPQFWGRQDGESYTIEDVQQMEEWIMSNVETEEDIDMFDEMMEPYTEQIEARYAQIDAEAQAAILELRAQASARGLYSADMLLSMEQDIYAQAAAAKSAFYGEILATVAQQYSTQKMEEARLAQNQAQYESTLAFNKYDSDRENQFRQKEFDADQGWKEKEYNLDVAALNMRNSGGGDGNAPATFSIDDIVNNYENEFADRGGNESARILVENNLAYALKAEGYGGSAAIEALNKFNNSARKYMKANQL